MLVLSRKPGETIHIGRDVTITLVEIQGNRVKIGIQAADELPILRGELCTAEPLKRSGELTQPTC